MEHTTTGTRYTFALLSSGREIENVEAEEFSTEAEAMEAGELALDDMCPRGSAARRFYRVEVRTA